MKKIIITKKENNVDGLAARPELASESDLSIECVVMMYVRVYAGGSDSTG